MRSVLSIILVILGGCVLVGCSAPTPTQVVQRAQQAIEDGHFARAINMLENARKKAPQNTDLLETLAFAQLNGGDPAKAGELFNTLALDTTPDYHLYAATAFKKANLPQKAIEAYSLYLLNEPDQSNPWQELGNMHREVGDLDEALKAYLRSHKLEPTPSLALTIAEVSQENNLPTQATQYYQSALKQAKAKRPTDSEPTTIESDSLIGLAQLAIANQKISEAKRHIRQLEREFPSLVSEISLLKAATDPVAIEEPAAKPETPTADTQESPTNQEATDTATANDNSDNASEDITQLVGEDSTTPTEPSKPEAVKPVVDQEKEDTSENISEDTSTPTQEIAPAKPQPKDPFLVALEKDSKNPRRWAELAQKKFLEGDYTWAEAAYLEALRLKPMDTQYTLSYLEVVRKRRAPRDFIRECEKLLERNGDKIPELYLVTARAYRDLLKNNRNASILMQEFLKKFPNSLEASEVRNELNALPR